MTPISDRFALPLLALLLIVAACVFVNSGVNRFEDDCADPEAFEQLHEVPGTWRVFNREARKNETRVQWTDAFALNHSPVVPRFAVRLVRSFVPYYLLSRPKSIMARRFSPDRERIEALETPWGDIKVHFDFRLQGSQVEVVAYLFLYRDVAVRNVFWELVRSAFEPLFGPTRPVTVVLLYGSGPVSKRAEMEEDALSWFQDLAAYYWEVCHPDTPFASPNGAG